MLTDASSAAQAAKLKAAQTVNAERRTKSLPRAPTPPPPPPQLKTVSQRLAELPRHPNGRLILEVSPFGGSVGRIPASATEIFVMAEPLEESASDATIKALKAQRTTMAALPPTTYTAGVIREIDSALHAAQLSVKSKMPLAKQLQIAESDRQQAGDNVAKAGAALDAFDITMAKAISKWQEERTKMASHLQLCMEVLDTATVEEEAARAAIVSESGAPATPIAAAPQVQQETLAMQHRLLQDLEAVQCEKALIEAHKNQLQQEMRYQFDAEMEEMKKRNAVALQTQLAEGSQMVAQELREAHRYQRECLRAEAATEKTETSVPSGVAAEMATMAANLNSEAEQWKKEKTVTLEMQAEVWREEVKASLRSEALLEKEMLTEAKSNAERRFRNEERRAAPTMEESPSSPSPKARRVEPTAETNTPNATAESLERKVAIAQMESRRLLLQQEAAEHAANSEHANDSKESASEQSLQAQSQVSWERRQRISGKTAEMAAGLVGPAPPVIPVTVDPYAVMDQPAGAGVLY
jgi:hypothetical protein